jgi:hypothetical protein
MDARCAAMTQMASMTPSELAKCIAPSLQLWSTAHDEPIMETLDLNKKTIEEAIAEMNKQNGVLFLESPQQIGTRFRQLIYSTEKYLGQFQYYF